MPLAILYVVVAVAVVVVVVVLVVSGLVTDSFITYEYLHK